MEQKKMIKINSKLAVLLIACCCLFTLAADKAFCREIKFDEKINIKLPYLPEKVKIGIGSKPITLRKELLSKILPELKEPTRLSYDDLTDENQKELFIEEGRTFVLAGDFNKDGYADLAFLVKEGEKSLFARKKIYLVIVSFRKMSVIREYVCEINNPQAFLSIDPNYKKGYDGIHVGYKFETDWYDVIYWNGKKYTSEN